MKWDNWYRKPVDEKGNPEKPKKSESDQPNKKVSWSGTQIEKGVNVCQVKKAYILHQAHTTVKPMTLKKIDFNEDLVLDTGATFSSMKNKSLLAGVHAADTPIQK